MKWHKLRDQNAPGLPLYVSEDTNWQIEKEFRNNDWGYVLSKIKRIRIPTHTKSPCFMVWDRVKRDSSVAKLKRIAEKEQKDGEE